MTETRYLLLIAGVLLLAACGGEVEPGRSSAEAPVVTGLTLQLVGPSALAARQDYVGSVESSDRATLTARIDGRVGRIAVREGETVAAGALLLTIEGNAAAPRLAEAEGLRQAAAARLSLAEKTAARFRQLHAAEAVTAQEMDRVESELLQAREGVRAADAAVAQAQTFVAQTRVTAPYAARVVQRSVEVGSTVLPGSPLLVLDRAGDWQVRLSVPESEIGGLALGDELNVEIPARQLTLSGRVVELQPASDPGSRSFQVKLALPAQAQLSAGLFARVGRSAPSGEALLLPMSAVVTRGQLAGIFVVDQQLLRFRLVKTGRQVGENVEILSGLTSGETVVVGGLERARSGARVGN